MIKKSKKPWPTKAAMEQVYNLNLWGNNDNPFYSGSGSHDAFIVEPYIEAVKKILLSFENPQSICDLGCGDFNIGKQLVAYTSKYIAVDIVPNLIDHNIKTFNEPNLEFKCLDIAKDDLPNADGVIIRQVLQHLSNKEIINIVEKLSQFKYVILTEHLPLGEFQTNIDIISGQGIRIKKKSGVDVLASPFNLKIKSKKNLLNIELPNNKGLIKTELFIL